MLLASLTLLANCAASGRPGNCDGWRPILIHPNDQLTQETGREILAHNRNGVARSCWKHA